MKHYKNAELKREFGVSNATLHKWIKDTIAGKKELELIVVKGKKYIARTDNNITLIEKYKEIGFKYKPSSRRIISKPKDDYVKFLTDRQIIEIKKSISEKKRIDIKFAYINGGAQLWNDVFNHSQGGSKTIDNPYHRMNRRSIPSIADLVGDKKINIYDVGAGNGVPILGFLREFEKLGKLNSYTALDISSEMNKIAEDNISKEFPELSIKTHVVDIENESFEEIIYNHNRENPDTVNLIVIFGASFGNYPDPNTTISNVEKSMTTGDLMCINNPFPNPQRFRSDKYMFERPTIDHYLYAIRSMGLHVKDEDMKFYFDEEKKMRTLYVEIPFDHTIKVIIHDKEESINVNKGDKIEIWRSKMTDLDYIQNITQEKDLKLVYYALSSSFRSILTLHIKEER